MAATRRIRLSGFSGTLRVAAALAVLLAVEPAVSAPPDPRAEGAAARPNILWITAEDMSPDLGSYGEPYATTPRLDRLARESVRYTHAFASAPVCSPARSCLITGVRANALGTQHLRSRFPIPERFRGFPAYLREAGYYTTNNVKTDYNTANEAALIADSWDEQSARAHWRGRQAGQPFFSVFNIMLTHQSRSSVWSFAEFEKKVGAKLEPDERHDPSRAPLPPYYPDTPAVRRTLARYHDCITAMDREVGRILDELARDGLAGDTIVFFFSDHGAGLPRGKRVLHDSGLRVPLLVRFPDEFRSLAPAAPGGVTDRLVSFLDFAPTVLSLAAAGAPGRGPRIPPHMKGYPFLGPFAGKPREYVYGARDRVDEAFELSRSVRDARFLYIRNYMPHLSWNQPERYSDAADMRREIARLAAEGKLGAAQMTYASPRKPLEELYDTSEDPHQVRNLARSPEHRDRLARMRRLHREWVLETRDLGYLPEPEVWRRAAGTTPFEMARDGSRYPLERILEAAGLVGRDGAVRRQADLLADPDSAVRYWAAVGLRASGTAAASELPSLRKALEDTAPSVRVEAAAAVRSLDGDDARALRVLESELRGDDVDLALHAARSLELLGDRARPAKAVMERVLARARARENDDAPSWLFVRFSLEAALERLR